MNELRLHIDTVITGGRQSGKTTALVNAVLPYVQQGRRVCIVAPNSTMTNEIAKQIIHRIGVVPMGLTFMTPKTLRRGLDFDVIAVDNMNWIPDKEWEEVVNISSHIPINIVAKDMTPYACSIYI